MDIAQPNSKSIESVRIRYGSFVPKEPLDIPVEQFISMLRFESKGKLDDFGLEIGTNTRKSGAQRFESDF